MILSLSGSARHRARHQHSENPHRISKRTDFRNHARQQRPQMCANDRQGLQRLLQTERKRPLLQAILHSRKDGNAPAQQTPL